MVIWPRCISPKKRWGWNHQSLVTSLCWATIQQALLGLQFQLLYLQSHHPQNHENWRKLSVCVEVGMTVQRAQITLRQSISRSWRCYWKLISLLSTALWTSWHRYRAISPAYLKSGYVESRDLICFSFFQLKEYIDDTEDFINIQLVRQHILFSPYLGYAYQIYAFLTLLVCVTYLTECHMFLGQCAEPADPVWVAANDCNICCGHFRSGSWDIWDELWDISFQNRECIPVGPCNYFSGRRFHLLLLPLVLQVQETDAFVECMYMPSPPIGRMIPLTM